MNNKNNNQQNKPGQNKNNAWASNNNHDRGRQPPAAPLVGQPAPVTPQNNAWNRNTNNNQRQTAVSPSVVQLPQAMQNMSLSGNNSRPTGQASGSSQVPSQAPTNSVTKSTASQPGSSPGKGLASKVDKAKDKPEDKSEKSEEKKSTFFDTQYATTAALGQKGTKVKLRVNMFNIPLSTLPAKYFVYSVTLDTVNDRVLTKRPLKKSLIHKVLSEQQPWSPEFDQNLIYTDWNSIIVTTKPLAELATGDVVSDNGEIFANYKFLNQSDPPGTVPIDKTATIVLSHVIDRDVLAKYVSQGGDPTFNYSKHTTVLNHVAKHFAAQPGNAICIGSNKFFDFKQQGYLDLPSGMHARRGFFGSVRPVNNGIQLQINTKGAAFLPHGPIVPFLEKYFGKHFDPYVRDKKRFDEVWPEIRALLSHLRVRYRYDPKDPKKDIKARSGVLQDPENGPVKGRRKVINSFGKPANVQKFKHSFFTARETWTVQEHFNDHVLNKKLDYPNLPIINVGAKSTDKKPNMEVWVPMELLWIEPDQSHRSTVPDCDMDEMGKYIRTGPFDNVSRIMNHGRQLLQASRLQSILPMADNLSLVVGRRLSAPQIIYGDQKIPTGVSSRGQWNLADTKLDTKTTLKQLLVIVIKPQTRNNVRFPKDQLIGGDYGLREGLNYYGVYCSKYQLQTAASTSRNDLHEAYKAFEDNVDDPAQKKEKIRTVLVVLPGKDANDYAAVKSWGELHEGVNTICVTPRNQSRLNTYEMQANLALKFNAKLGGRNHQLEPAFKTSLSQGGLDTMVVGADVTHPGPASVDYCPSIAAVVASTDKEGMKYRGSIRLQASREEMITDLEGMILDKLHAWVSTHGTFPTNILYYRDGVSESQFGAIKAKELNAIKSACEKASHLGGNPNYKAKITVVICTKRHQTRFYPAANQGEKLGPDFDSRTGNPLPGMVVDDRSVRLPHYFDFYLQGHKALQGTARPCHYFVIENGIGYTPDQLQQVTNGLSWVYATSLTPISLAAPAYYADRLCERGRAYMRPALIGRHPRRPDMAPHLAAATTEDEARAAAVKYFNGSEFWPRPAHPVHNSIKNTMFWV